MILKFDVSLKKDLYTGADFSGLWNGKDHDGPIRVKNRTWFLLPLGDVHLIWYLKLQETIALSKMEADYILLSTGITYLVHVQHIFDKTRFVLYMKEEIQILLNRVHEDNHGVLILESSHLPKMTQDKNTLV